MTLPVLENITIVPGKKYRLRVIAATQLSYLVFRIVDHPLAIIEVDGHYTQPYLVDQLEINSGNRFSVLIDADALRVNSSNQGVFKMEVGVRWRKAGPTGLGYLIYDQNQHPIIEQTLSQMSTEIPPFVAATPPSVPGWIMNELKPLDPKPVPAATRQIIIAGRQVIACFLNLDRVDAYLLGGCQCHGWECYYNLFALVNQREAV